MSTVNRVVTAWVIYSTGSRADYCITKGINYSPLLVQDLKHTHTEPHIIMWQCKCKPIRLTLPQQVISASLHFVWRRRRVVIRGWFRGSLNLLTSSQPNSTCFVWILLWSQNQNRWTQLGCVVGGCWNKSVLITACIVRLCHPWLADVCLGFGLVIRSDIGLYLQLWEG